MTNSTILSFFAKYIAAELGIIYSEHNYFQLQNRLEDITKALGFGTLEKLFEQGQKEISGEFKKLLLDTATNNETSFFRDPRVFKAIASVVLNSFHQNCGTTEKMRIWSAASSAGQEALSTAMLIFEQAGAGKAPIDFSILGTDVSERILAKAKSGTYTQLEADRGLDAALLAKYFTKNGNGAWQSNLSLSSRVDYRKLNLKEQFAFPEKFHLILCRNVLIYQNVEGKIEILRRITEALEPGGHLILGSGESLYGLSDAFQQVASDGVVIYSKKLLRAA